MLFRKPFRAVRRLPLRIPFRHHRSVVRDDTACSYLKFGNRKTQGTRKLVPYTPPERTVSSFHSPVQADAPNAAMTCAPVESASSSIVNVAVCRSDGSDKPEGFTPRRNMQPGISLA